MWQEWGSWSECSTSCGKGFNFRARACGEPAFGGNDTCDGNSTESRECLTSHCPGYDPEVSESRFFQSRDENESFSDSISFIETRPRVPDTYSQASRRDREKISSNLGHRDEIEIYYLHSHVSRREREFP